MTTPRTANGRFAPRPLVLAPGEPYIRLTQDAARIRFSADVPATPARVEMLKRVAVDLWRLERDGR